MANIRWEGIEDFQRLLERVGRIPPAALTYATKAGAKMVLAQAKLDAPVKSGKLRKGLKLRAEKRKTGKKVYQIIFNEKMNDIFVKVGRPRSGRFISQAARPGERYYYPASQEYGFKTKNGGYVRGKYFIKNAVRRLRTSVQEAMLEKLMSTMSNLVNGGG